MLHLSAATPVKRKNTAFSYTWVPGCGLPQGEHEADALSWQLHSGVTLVWRWTLLAAVAAWHSRIPALL